MPLLSDLFSPRVYIPRSVADPPEHSAQPRPLGLASACSLRLRLLLGMFAVRGSGPLRSLPASLRSSTQGLVILKILKRNARIGWHCQLKA